MARKAPRPSFASRGKRSVRPSHASSLPHRRTCDCGSGLADLETIPSSGGVRACSRCYNRKHEAHAFTGGVAEHSDDPRDGSGWHYSRNPPQRNTRSTSKSEKRGWHIVREPGQRLAYRSDDGARDAFFDPWQRLWTVQLLDGNGSSVADAIQYTASRDEMLAMLTSPVSEREQVMIDDAKDVRPQRFRIRR